MEYKPKGQEYRDKLAGTLREIRNEEDVDSQKARARAQGYLDAKQESSEFKDAKKEHVKDRDQMMKEKEIAEHGIEWLRECSKDGGKALDEYLNASRDAVNAGLGGIISSVKVLDIIERRYANKGGINFDKLNNTAYRLVSRLEIAIPPLFENIDWERLKREHKIAGQRDFVDKAAALAEGRPYDPFYGEAPTSDEQVAKLSEFVGQFQKTEQEIAQDKEAAKQETKAALEAEIAEKQKKLDELK